MQHSHIQCYNHFTHFSSCPPPLSFLPSPSSPLLPPLSSLPSVSAQFTELPNDQTVAEGNPVTVTCTYPGAISLVWCRNNIPILSNSPFFGISSANSSSSVLTINSANHNHHAGNYQCVAHTDSNESRVTNFTITVQCELQIHLTGLAQVLPIPETDISTAIDRKLGVAWEGD